MGGRRVAVWCESVGPGKVWMVGAKAEHAHLARAPLCLDVQQPSALPGALHARC